LTAFRQEGLGFFTKENIERNFPWRSGGPPVHPPLGNLMLASVHHLFDMAPNDPRSASIVPARFAPALALGALVLVVGFWTTRAEGPLAGSVAAAAVVLVPRVFGHAHLAALDTITALAFVAAVLAVAEADARGGRWWHFALAGVIWGLAMLVRIHGLLLLPAVVVWLAWRLRRRIFVPLVAWGAAGMATLFVGWPWLWLAPIAHFRQFVGTATGREAIHVFYAGRVWADHEAPWHYPVVMFAVTLPLGLLLLGLLGAWAKRRPGQGDPGYFLVMGSLAVILLVFSWPGTPVYDGTRLFLMVFPLWAVSVGVGARWLVDHATWQRVSRTIRLVVVGLFVALQGVGLALYHPCQLSHYSLLVGGLPGADRLGFEVNYWGDAVEESLLAEAASLAPGRAVLFAPSLAGFQLIGVGNSSPALMRAQVALVGWDGSWTRPPAPLRYAVLYHRKADLASIPEAVRSANVIAEHQKQGVWLARLVELPRSWGQGAARNVPGRAAAK
ncbi:MAG: glycosyltransferase family 39 protein, partial [Planctomycetes bacterium]|nr:glycosyltransferase family 39 protein [Planctomycetota bacterium]